MAGVQLLKATEPLRGDNLLFTSLLVSPEELMVLVWSTPEG